MNRNLRLVVAGLVTVAATTTALIWTRSVYDDNVERALAQIEEHIGVVVDVERSVSERSLLGQVDRFAITPRVGETNQAKWQLVATSRLLFFPAIVTGTLDLEFLPTAHEPAGLKIEAGRNAGRWWFNALAGKADITYHSPEIKLRDGSGGVALTIEQTELVANLYTFQRSFNYRGVWRGLQGRLSDGTNIEIGRSVYKGAGRFDVEPQYQWHSSFIKLITVTSAEASLSIAELRMRNRQRNERGYLDVRGVFSSGAISCALPDGRFDADSSALDYRIRHLHAGSYEELIELRRASPPGSEQQATAALLKLASYGVSFNLDQLMLRRGEERSLATAHFNIARPKRPFTDFVELKTEIDAGLSFDASPGWLADGSLLASQLVALIDQGLLQRNEEGRVGLQASVSDGTVTVNGNSRPL